MIRSVDSVESVREEDVIVSEGTGSDEVDLDPAQPDPAQPDPVEPEPEPDPEPAVTERAARERGEVRAPAARRHDDARHTARRARQDAKRDRAAVRAAKRDHIVEAPREPKASIAQRLRGTSAARPAPAPGARRKRILRVLAGLVGAVGLLCSVVLAVGALLVAMGSDDGSLYDTTARLCDALVGPLRDAFSFSGTNADMKESLVAWGAGSIVYLLVGLVAQSLLRSAADD